MRQKILMTFALLLAIAQGAWAEGELNGKFTINASGDKVQFSQGNLQWSGTNGWRFASNQWDIIGSKANNTSPTSSNDNYMDLFCWGATGLNGVAPNTADSYLSGSSVLSGNNDWGTNMGASWRTLTSDEWAYLFNTRASGSTVNGTSNARYAFATIRTDVNSGINGIILFPDGVNFAASEFTTLGTVNGVSSYATKCTSDQWTALEGKGCVFLPAAGSRLGSTVSYAGVHGCYWSSSPYASYEADKAYDVYFGNVLSLPRDTRRFFGSSVRLVKDYQLQQDGEGYYLLGSVQDWKDFATLVQTTPTANAKMTADIDLGDDQTMVGTYAVKYQGTFDGQGHTLTFNYNTSSMSIESGQSFLGAAPFRDIEGATIRNLHTAGSIIADKTGASGLVGWAYGTNTLEKCWSDVNIASSNNTADTFTGFVAFMYGTSINITDCIFTGLIQSTSKQSHSGFIGYHYSGTSALTNCLVILDEGSDTNEYNSWLTTFFTFDRFASSDQSAGTYTNCYYYRDFGVAQGTKATAAQLSDGTIAYKLQNHRGDLVWGQRIGTDTEPVLTNDENYRVYRSKNGGYTNDPEEAYEDIQQDEEGNYLIASVQNWQDFAEIVNSGTNPAANAKMTADIDLSTDQTMVGTYAVKYQGTFDGQGHTLTFNYNTSSMSIESGQSYLGAAPFRDIEGATIRNLRTAGSITADKIGASGLVGWAYGTNTIENCWSDVNIASSNNTADTFTGFVAFMYGTSINITDCIFTGCIQSTCKKSHSGFIGYHYSGTSALTNCLVILDEGSDTNQNNSWLTTFFTFDRFASSDQSAGTYTNCYYYRDFGVAQGTKATTAQLADGTTATALQNSRAEDVWVQDPVTNQPMLALFAGKYTVPASGLGTFSAKTNFTLPEGLEAYVCKTYDSGKSTISTQKVEGTIPANTGVLMKGIGGETYTLTASSETPEAIESNALIAVVEATHVDQTVGEYTNFMMSGGKFVKIAASSNPNDKIPANRAYLPILTSALPAGSGQSITLNWDEATGVKAVRDVQFMINSYYTLDGRKLNGAPSKGGVYINNGKKVIK